MLGLLVRTRGSQTIPVYSPVGFTANLKPLILWKNRPGKTYDLSISDELTATLAPLVCTRVIPPIAFTNAWPGRTLAADGLYRFQIAEVGQPLSVTELIFRTMPTADGQMPVIPAVELFSVYQMLTASPARFGDALAELLTLPPGLADCELGLRLRLFAFGQLGYQQDYEAVAAQLKTVPR